MASGNKYKLRIEARAIDGSFEQIAYSGSEAVDFASNSSYWMQYQLNSFDDFKKDFGKLLAKMDTDAPSSAVYAKDFAIQAAATVDQLSREVEKLGISRETDSSTEAMVPSEIVRHVFQAMDTAASFHSMLVSHAYQSASAANEKKMAVRLNCALEPDCKLHELGALLTTVATGTLNATSSNPIASYRMNRCPEQCRLILWKSDFLLQKWTEDAASS
ncbi:hypothetical protein BU26DRAFT_546710 [Trematosphaeria pertusa]|uniref:Uncharacterized protein n=1 Tax=Trematosphaeria pertusa TaxID=390896 RepID=A0A6A6IV98_9PLEO|nr:uncharacterized protein BU26DRAFT_546710 [Trematosphaeria pertusa]KAF2254495.1 hypothetical protein BU26DRAFT_546710 [Trematosphaeria pertusa]